MIPAANRAVIEDGRGGVVERRKLEEEFTDFVGASGRIQVSPKDERLDLLADSKLASRRWRMGLRSVVCAGGPVGRF